MSGFWHYAKKAPESKVLLFSSSNFPTDECSAFLAHLWERPRTNALSQLGYRKRAGAGLGPEPEIRWPPSRLPILAGILLILSGTLGFLAVVVGFLGGTPSDPQTPVVSPWLLAPALLVVWAQPLAIMGGVLTLQRSNWKTAVACALAGTLTIGFVIEASLLAAVGLLLLVASRPEFSDAGAS